MSAGKIHKIVFEISCLQKFITHKHTDKSVVFLSGAALDPICRFGRYIFRAGIDYNGDTY